MFTTETMVRTEARLAIRQSVNKVETILAPSHVYELSSRFSFLNAPSFLSPDVGLLRGPTATFASPAFACGYEGAPPAPRTGQAA